MLQSRQGFGHLLRRTITEFQGSSTYLRPPLPSATFQQLPSSIYLAVPAATSQHLPTIYGSSTYLQSTVHHLPTSTIRPTTFLLPLLLRYYPSLLDLVTSVTFTPSQRAYPASPTSGLLQSCERPTHSTGN